MSSDNNNLNSIDPLKCEVIPTLKTSNVSDPVDSSNSSENYIESNTKIDENSLMLKQRLPEVYDRYHVIYFVFLFFGIACLLPWNVFITAQDYFTDKLNTTESENSTYLENFTYITGLVGQSTNVFMNFFNIFVNLGGNPRNRIPYTLVLSGLVVVFQAVLAYLDTETWPFTFFMLCVLSIFVMYVATGIFGSCVFYVVSMFPMQYVNAIVLGNNLSGIFCTLMSILSKLLSANQKYAALTYFMAAFLVIMIAFIGYFVMLRTEYYKYWERMVTVNKKFSQEEKIKEPKINYIRIIKKIWPLLFCIWLNFFSTLAVFPVYLIDVKPVSSSFIIGQKWFLDIVTFLTFNIFVTIGPKWIAIPVIARAVLQFLFYALCNYAPSNKTRNLPVLITNDYVMWFGGVLSPLLFGYFTSLLMMYTPKQVDPEDAGTAGMLSGLTLVIGVLSGLQFSKQFGFLVAS